jgi:hypothetical protein
MGRQKPNKTSKSPNKQTNRRTRKTTQHRSLNKYNTPIRDSTQENNRPHRAIRKSPNKTISHSHTGHICKQRINTEPYGQDRTRKRTEKTRRSPVPRRRRIPPNSGKNRTRTQYGRHLDKPQDGNELSPTQSDLKEAAQDSNASSPSTTTRQKISHRQRDDEKMKKMFDALANNTKLQLKQQEERHAKEIADMR